MMPSGNDVFAERPLGNLREQGFSLHERGELLAAETTYREVLRRCPDDLEIRRALGYLANQSGRHQEALELIGRLSDEDATANDHCNLGDALLGLARFQDAVGCYDRAIALEPSLFAALLNRGQSLRSLGHREQALASYDSAIECWPDFLQAHLSRAHLLLELDRPGDALAGYDKVLRLQPGTIAAHLGRGFVLSALRRWAEALSAYDQAAALGADQAELYFHRGNVLLRLQQWQPALESYDLAIRCQPGLAGAHVGRGTALLQLERPMEAISCYEQAIGADPNSAEAFMGRGRVLKSIGSREAALVDYERAIELDPSYAEAYNNRGSVLHDLGDWQAALSSFDQAIALNPDSAEAHSGRGMVLQSLKQPAAALASYDRAIDLDPDLALARFNRASVLLVTGDYEKGWTEFEWRKRLTSRAAEPPRPWSGQESLAGKTILLYAEQGLGDTIQFCRYIKLVADQGAAVVLAAPQPLQALLKNLPGVAVIVESEAALPPFDFSCSLLSLPLAFNTTLASIPAQLPYLFTSDDRRSHWKRRLGEKRKPRVGLAWSGGFRPEQSELWPVHQRRNVPLMKLAALRSSDLEYYSLQKGQPAESELALALAKEWEGPKIIDLTDELLDLEDTASLIEQLDLVISVDTSIAHLTGALGKPFWLLNRFDTCWRWLLDGADSPWYPSARLYRQGQPGEWDGLIERVSGDLDLWVREVLKAQS